MSIPCKVIEDLLPLYNDEVCSKESRTIVEEHLKDCKMCQDYLNSINVNVFEKQNKVNIEEAKANSLKLLKKKLLRKNMIISIISVLCSVLIIVGGYYMIFHYSFPINYEDGLVDVMIPNDGEPVDEDIPPTGYTYLDIFFRGKDYYRSNTLNQTIEQDGVKKDVAFIYYDDTLWTKYFSNPKEQGNYHMAVGNGIMIDYEKSDEAIEVSKEIDAVYYLIGDYPEIAKSKLSLEESNKLIENAVLLWEK